MLFQESSSRSPEPVSGVEFSQAPHRCSALWALNQCYMAINNRSFCSNSEHSRLPAPSDKLASSQPDEAEIKGLKLEPKTFPPVVCGKESGELEALPDPGLVGWVEEGGKCRGARKRPQTASQIALPGACTKLVPMATWKPPGRAHKTGHKAEGWEEGGASLRFPNGDNDVNPCGIRFKHSTNTRPIDTDQFS
ncbi:hypothetical protein E5288_WYG004252 [Bos mutus]|uniref:Uncharacterized protein n=1 Tax=Bos mutus TaxID=72004 RepID=A0A6B0R4N6_9CETA|nr:hypothetical protein [Bos mutus]